jgi:cytochrome d ubiquinol oxidase subunit I
VFAVVGIGMPLLMVLSEWRWLRSGEEIDLPLAKRWAKGHRGIFRGGRGLRHLSDYQVGRAAPPR